MGDKIVVSNEELLSVKVEGLIVMLDKLVDDFTSHNHCLRCRLPLKVCEENRDFICSTCKGKIKELNKVLVPGMK